MPFLCKILHYHEPKQISVKGYKGFFGQKYGNFEGEKSFKLPSQIWIIPLFDDQESTYFTKLKNLKFKKKNHASNQLNIATQYVVAEPLYKSK